MTKEEIQEGYLSLVQAELSDYGIDGSLISIDGIGRIQVEEHLLDMPTFLSANSWSRPDMFLRVYSLEDGRIIFRPDHKFEDEYRNSDTLFEELAAFYNKANTKVQEFSTEYFASLRELNDHKTLAERIPALVAQNLQVSESLEDVKSWKAKIILGNSMGKDSPEVGEWDNVGYTHIGLNTGTVLPVARGDEHHRGSDLVWHLIEQGLIPQDTYYPIFFNHDYVDGFDPIALQALKTWRKLGGPNIIIENSSRNHSTNFKLTIDDYIKSEGQIEVSKGTLLPLGEGLINHLKKLSESCIEFRSTQRGEKAVYLNAAMLLRFYEEKILQYSNDSFKVVQGKVNEAKTIGGTEGLQKLEEAIFGFDGLKNQLHQKVRKALDPKSMRYERSEMEAIFGDLDFANHQLGSL